MDFDHPAPHIVKTPQAEIGHKVTIKDGQLAESTSMSGKADSAQAAEGK